MDPVKFHFYFKVLAQLIAASHMIIDILFFHCSFVDMLNIILTCWDILCVDINVDQGCVDHSTSDYIITPAYLLHGKAYLLKPCCSSSSPGPCGCTAHTVFLSPPFLPPPSLLPFGYSLFTPSPWPLVKC